MKKIKNKFVIPTVLSLSIVSSVILCSYAFSQLVIEKSITTNTNNKLMNWSREDEMAHKDRYIKDALLKDAQEWN